MYMITQQLLAILAIGRVIPSVKKLSGPLMWRSQPAEVLAEEPATTVQVMKIVAPMVSREATASSGRRSR